MTKQQIAFLLATSDKAVERAMLAIYARQTQDEQSSQTTKHSNGQGFNAFDALNGTYYAKWVLSGRKLSGSHLAKARKMALRYTQQLALISQAKLLSQTVSYITSGSLASLDPFQSLSDCRQSA